MLVLVNDARVPARNLKEFIALAKSQPRKLNFGSAGNGSQVHMAGEALADAAGIQMHPSPYKGEGPGLQRPARRPGATGGRQ